MAGFEPVLNGAGKKFEQCRIDRVELLGTVQKVSPRSGFFLISSAYRNEDSS